MDFKITANTKTINKICVDLDKMIARLDRVRATKEWSTVNKLLGKTTGGFLEILYSYERIDKNNVKFHVRMAGVGKGSLAEKQAIKEVIKRTKKYGKEVKIEVV